MSMIYRKAGIPERLFHPGFLFSDFSLLSLELQAEILTFSLCLQRYNFTFPREILSLIFSELCTDFWNRIQNSQISAREHFFATHESIECQVSEEMQKIYELADKRMEAQDQQWWDVWKWSLVKGLNVPFVFSPMVPTP
jgi:hypothetical protein